MFGKSIKLFTLFGFEVKIDLSWFILAILITWSLAEGVFPVYYRGLATATYWWMGIGGAVGLLTLGADQNPATADSVHYTLGLTPSATGRRGFCGVFLRAVYLHCFS